MTTDAVQDLTDLRAKVLSGQEVSAAEYERILTALRANRRSGAESKKKKGTKTSTTMDPTQADNLLNSVLG